MRKGRGGNRTIKADEASAFAKRGLSSRPASSGQKSERLLGIDRNIIAIHGDIIDPLDIEWEAEVDPARVLNP